VGLREGNQRLNAYVDEISWPEDNWRVSNGDLYLTAVGVAANQPMSRQWRAELAGQFEHHQAKARHLLMSIDSLDATIRMLAPDIPLINVKPKPLRAALHIGAKSRGSLSARYPMPSEPARHKNSPCSLCLGAA
jgi:hypothetical protein